MKKADPVEPDTLRPEYRREDLGKGVRGKYLAAHRQGSNLVWLSPEVAKAFPTSEAVNDALRGLMELARTSTRRRAPRPSSPS